MATCPTGASVKAGIDPATQVLVDRSLWETVTGTASSWLDPILDQFEWSTIRADQLCALNLDDPPLPSVGDIAAALLRDPSSLLTLISWVRDKLRYVAFSNTCTCNPPGAGVPCTTYLPTFKTADCTYATSAIGPNSCYVNSGSEGLPAGAPYTVAIPAGQHRVTFQVLLPAPYNGAWEIYSAGLAENVFTHGISGSMVNVVTHDMPLSAAAMTIVLIRTGFSTILDTPCRIDFQPIPGSEPACGSTTPPVPVQPTQPPLLKLPPSWLCANIGDICVRLQQISDRLEWARRDVTLIQRQKVPFAYLLGTSSSGLTGSGDIAVQAILGLSVSLTTVPVSWGRTADVPARLIPKAGAVQLKTADGYTDELQLHYLQQLLLDVPGDITQVHYSLRPGIVATIQQLLREP